MIIGHAKPPKGMSAADVYSTLSLAMIVEARYGVVLEASGSLVTESARDFIRELLVGESLADDPEPVLNAIRRRYFGAASAALQAAWKDAVAQFQRARQLGQGS
ncbi:MAG: DUF3870 domain-containing protein [Actinomycetia bacterium]|nr:DUF3870 domain-containing protein [Actinomycetes bacterium]